MSERREHNDELNEAPELKKLGRKDPFQVPDGYFEALEERVKGEVWREDPYSSILAEAGKGEVFKTPDNYFEKVLENFEKNKQEDAVIKPMKSKLIPFYYLAGIAAAFILFMFFVRPDIFPSKSVELEFAELEDISVEDLLAEVRAEELSEDMILTTLDEGAWEDWIEEEVQGSDFGESDEEDYEGLIEELDVYSLEEELDNLN